jgi:Cys-Gly metallodipeptidase DUG1
MAHWLNDQLKALGVDTKLVDLRKEVLDGQEPELPPTILQRRPC